MGRWAYAICDIRYSEIRYEFRREIKRLIDGADFDVQRVAQR